MEASLLIFLTVIVLAIWLLPRLLQWGLAKVWDRLFLRYFGGGNTQKFDSSSSKYNNNNNKRGYTTNRGAQTANDSYNHQTQKEDQSTVELIHETNLDLEGGEYVDYEEIRD